MKHIFYFLLISLAFSATSCSFSYKEKSGEKITDERDLEAVSRLVVTGVFNLYLSQGDQPSIRVEGDDDMVASLNIIQNGDLLELEYEKESGGFFDNSSLDVYLKINDLKALEFDGVGNIKTEDVFIVEDLNIAGNGVGNIALGFEANSINAEFNMMGNLNLRGSANEMVLVNEGIGNVDASNLIVKNLDVASVGIGKMDVHCTGNLAIQVDGIGAVNYRGNPTVVKEEINGIGKVSRN